MQFLRVFLLTLLISQCFANFARGALNLGKAGRAFMRGVKINGPNNQYLNAFNKWTHGPKYQMWCQKWVENTWKTNPLVMAQNPITPKQVHNFVIRRFGERFAGRLTPTQNKILASIATFSQRVWVGFKKQLTDEIIEYLKEEIQDLISEMIRKTIEDSTDFKSNIQNYTEDIKKFTERLCNDIPENTGSEEKDKWENSVLEILNEGAKNPKTFIDKLTVANLGAKLTEKLENDDIQSVSIQTKMKNVLYKYCCLPRETQLPMGVGTLLSLQNIDVLMNDFLINPKVERRRMAENTISERRHNRRRMARLHKAELRGHA